MIKKETFDFKVEKNIGVLTLHHPPVNAWIEEMRVGLAEIFEDLNRRTDVYVVIIRAEGKGFSAGHDLNEKESLNGVIRPSINRLYNAVYNCRVPIICAVHGYCVGMGFALATLCDIVICTENSYFKFPEVKVGTTAGPFWFKRVFPDKLVRYYFYTASEVTPAEMYRFGAVNRIVPEDELMKNAYEIAEKISKEYPAAVWAIKKTIVEGEKEVQNVVEISDRMRNKGNDVYLKDDPNKEELKNSQLEHRTPEFDLSFLKSWDD